MTRAQELIETLRMSPHPERGFFVETYRSDRQVDAHGSTRAASTAIYFLLTRDEPFTFLHRLASDELFHLYEGGPMEVLFLREDGSSEVKRLGLDVAAGERPQLTIPAGTWFGAELASGSTHCLFGCTVAPGFDFADVALAMGPELLSRHPMQADRIARMSRRRG